MRYHLALALLLAAAPWTTGCVSSSRSSGASIATGDWSAADFSDPKRFRARKKRNPSFLFLVVAVLDPRARSTQHEMTAQEAELKNRPFDPSKAIDLLATPEKIADKPVISGSLIDHAHVQTWAETGFILQVPAENLVAASTQDLGIEAAMVPGTPGTTVQEVLRRAKRKFGLPPPDKLLEQTKPTRFNEVAMVGRTAGGSAVRITGAFIKADINTGADLCTVDQTRRIELLARKNGWPVVRILQPRPVTKNNKSKDSTHFDF